MADLLIRNLDEPTRASLKARAARHGRSVSAEALAILRSGVAEAAIPPAAGLATLMRKRIAELGITNKDAEAFDDILVENRRNSRWAPPSDFSE